MRVVLGGTFDPVHNGHIHLAQELVDKLNLNKVYLMPCFKAVHKASVEVCANQRLDMLRLAIKKYPSLALDGREIKQDGPSYTYTSLASIRAEEGEESVSFVMGIDSLLGFADWFKAKEIHSLANLIIIERPTSSFNITTEELKRQRLESVLNLESLGFSTLQEGEELNQYRSGKVLMMTLSLYDISSTDIRKKIKQSEKITHLVGAEVADYIQRHQLYKI